MIDTDIEHDAEAEAAEREKALKEEIYNAYEAAMESGSVDDVKSVYERYGGDGGYALAAMAARAPSVDVLRYVVDELDADPYYCDGLPLCTASHHGHMQNVLYLIEEKAADWKEKNERAFRWAVDGGQIEVMQYFLKKGADTEKLDAHLQEWSYQRGDDAPNYYWMKSRHPEAYQWYQDFKENRVKNHHRSKQSATRQWARNRKRNMPGV